LRAKPHNAEANAVLEEVNTVGDKSPKKKETKKPKGFGKKGAPADTKK
jgi:hypothetical protein